MKFRQLTHPKMGYKLCEFCESCTRDTPLRVVYIPHFDQISVKISVLGVLHPYHCTNGGETSVPSSVPKFTPSLQRVVAAGEKPQNRPLRNLNNRRFALRAMLPVNTDRIYVSEKSHKNVAWTFLCTWVTL